MACNLPSGISFSTSTTSATMYYTAGWNCYQVDVNLYSNSGYKYWERYSPCTPFNSNSYSITGLTPDTTYYVILRAIDYAGAWDGTYSGSYYFTTQSSGGGTCPSPYTPSMNTHDWDSNPSLEIINNVSSTISSGGYTVQAQYYFDFDTSIRNSNYIYYANVSRDSCTIYYRTVVSKSGYTSSSSSWQSYSWSRRQCSTPSISAYLSGTQAYCSVSSSDYFTDYIYYARYDASGNLLGSDTRQASELYIDVVPGGRVNFYGWETKYGWLTSANSNTVSVFRPNTAARPSNSSYFGYSSGQTMECEQISDTEYNVYVMTASNWNSFMDKVNEFRRYRGLSDFSYSVAASGLLFKAGYYNEAVDAINAMGFSLGYVSSSTDISASLFNTLENTLNSIS